MNTKIYNLLGGIGLLIYSLSMLSIASQHIFSSWFHKKFNQSETTKLKSFIQGLSFSFITESSRISTTTLSGLIETPNINFSNIYYFISGANIGASLIPILCILNISIIPYILIFIGTFILIFINKNNKYKYIGEFTLGLGLILLSLLFIENSFFEHPILNLIKNNAFSSFFLGIILAFILRSSNVIVFCTVPIVFVNIIDIKTAFFLIIGANMGSSSFVLYKAYKSEKHTKITAFMHFILNMFGTLSMLVIYFIFNNNLINSNIYFPLNIISIHILLNVLGSILSILFSKSIISSLKKNIFSIHNMYENKTFKYINPLVIETPAIAIRQCAKELIRMGEMSLLNLERAFDMILDYRRDVAHLIQKDEEAIDYLEESLMNFLTSLSMNNPSYQESEIIVTLYNTINDIERVGDHAINLLEIAEYKFNNYISFSEEANVELKYLYELSLESFKKALNALRKQDLKYIEEVTELENKIDSVEKQLRKDHIDRLNKNICSPSNGMIFLDALTNLERIGDHSHNIVLAARDIIDAIS